jgi:hypothetical protein
MSQQIKNKKVVNIKKRLTKIPKRSQAPATGRLSPDIEKRIRQEITAVRESITKAADAVNKYLKSPAFTSKDKIDKYAVARGTKAKYIEACFDDLLNCVRRESVINKKHSQLSQCEKLEDFIKRLFDDRILSTRIVSEEEAIESIERIDAFLFSRKELNSDQISLLRNLQALYFYYTYFPPDYQTDQCIDIVLLDCICKAVNTITLHINKLPERYRLIKKDVSEKVKKSNLLRELEGISRSIINERPDWLQEQHSRRGGITQNRFIYEKLNKLYPERYPIPHTKDGLIDIKQLKDILADKKKTLSKYRKIITEMVREEILRGKA